MCNDHSGFGWEWGAITDSTTWTDNDARVVCRQLGLPTSGSFPYQKVPGEIQRSMSTAVFGRVNPGVSTVWKCHCILAIGSHE